MTKLKIDRSNPFRVLLTEVLPFETPLSFTNEGFYCNASQNFHGCPRIVKDLLNYAKTNPTQKNRQTKNHWTKAYSYKINRGCDKIRTLGLMHPSIQIQVCEFYKI
ncbi:hypothetical protein ACFL54_08180, partial [Planctomycetota bacterium]